MCAIRNHATRLAASAALAFAAMPPPAAAQGAALNGQEILALVGGKVIVYRNEKRAVGPAGNVTGYEPRRDGSYAIVSLTLRADRSVRVQCTHYARSGATSACPGISANDVGVWSVEGSALCIKWLNWGGSVPRCYRLLREGAGYRAQQIAGGPSSMDGELVTVK